MPFAFSIQALYERLETVTDRCDPRGVRYPLSALLLVAVLGRLAGSTRLAPLSDWSRLSCGGPGGIVWSAGRDVR